MKINTKINLYFLITFAIVSFATYFFVNKRTVEMLDINAYKEIYNINKIRAEHVNTFLNSEREVVLSLASSTVFRDYLKLAQKSEALASKEISRTRLNRSIQSVTQINELFLIDSKGKVVASTDRTQEGLDKTKDLYFINGQKDVYVKDFYLSPITKKINYAVSAPIKDDNTGELLGVVVARMNPENLYKIVLSNLSIGESGETFLVNKDRYFISPSKFLGSDVVLNKKVLTQNADECFSKKDNDEAKKYVDYRGIPIVGSHTYLPDVDWCIITKMDYSEIITDSKTLTTASLIAGLLSLALFAIVGAILSKNITSPISTLKEATKK